jgi:NodT family efflux transporter outer membrane factor (OMF) lipoprotein
MRFIAELDVISLMVTSKIRKCALLMKPQVLSHLVILVLITSCTVGPDFTVPDPPDVQSLTPRPLSGRVDADGKVQRFLQSRDIPGEWWRLFRSRELTGLMERALRDNHDLKSAQAALRVARANYEAQKGTFFPVINLNEISSRQKVATADLAAPTVSGDPFYTLHTGQLTISYVPDVFGGIRRQVEAASAQAELQRFMLEATYLTLTSNIALAAIQEASLNEQIRETERAIDDERLLAEAGNVPGIFGSASSRDWAALRAAIAQAQQTIPLLKKQLAAQRDLLTALSGQLAGSGLSEHFSLAKLWLPRKLPVTLPSQLVEQRPDVRAAQANFHAAGALVGVAIANRIPLFNLTGNIGRTGSQFNNLFNAAPQFQFWTIAGSVTQTIFDGFNLAQRQRAAEAAWHQAAQQYSSTVVTAFQNVADALQAIELDGQSVASANDATKAARENLCLTVAGFVGYNGQYEPENEKSTLSGVRSNNPQLQNEIKRRFVDWWKGVCRPDSKLRAALRLDNRNNSASGNETDDCALSKERNDSALSKDKASCAQSPSAPSGIDVVTSEQLYLTTRLSLVIARATRYMDVVALFQALGGGWWNRLDVAEVQDRRLSPTRRLGE